MISSIKRANRYVLFWCCTLCLSAPGFSADFYNKHAEGWFWYQDPPILEEEAPAADEKNEKKTPLAPLTVAQQAHREMDSFKKKLDDLKVIALVNPTPINVETYMHVQKKMIERSDRFSKVWQQVVLSTPELNPEVNNPTAQYARHIKHDEMTVKKTETIQRLAKTYGLIYFFRGNCPYCTGFAPIVKMFAEKYKWNVLAVSLDGSPSEVFSDARPDNGIAKALAIQSVPALIAYNAETNDIIPISYAMTSLDQLENNVMALTGGVA